MVEETINISYQLFEKYKAKLPLDFCTQCCMTLENEKVLASLPVNKISRDLLAEYNDSARSEKTEIEELKHFLPRYLDLISKFDFPTHSAEISLARLIPFDKNEWTEPELHLLEQFCIDFFKHCLSIYPLPTFGDDIDAILIMFWRAEFKINPLLEIWENQSSKESVLHFRDLNFHGFDKHNSTKLFSSFGDKELAKSLISWMESDKVRQNFAKSIEKLIIDSSDLEEKDLNDLNLLYDIITTQSNAL